MELKGKTVDFLGDSITEGHGVCDIENNRYDNILKKRFGLKETYNYGIGGTRFAHQSAPSEKPRYDLCFCGRVYDLNKDADLIIVYGGINDYNHGDAPIGELGDTTPRTFCGAVDFLMRYLTENYSAKIVFLTPARCVISGCDYTVPSNRPMKREDAMPVRYYGNIVMETAKKYGIPVLDMYTAVPIDPLDPIQREKYTTDGLHFNDEGHKILASVIGDFLAAL